MSLKIKIKRLVRPKITNLSQSGISLKTRRTPRQFYQFKIFGQKVSKIDKFRVLLIAYNFLYDQCMFCTSKYRDLASMARIIFPAFNI